MKQPNPRPNGREGNPAQDPEDVLRAAGITFDDDPPPRAATDAPPPKPDVAPPKTPKLDDAALYGLAGEIARAMAPHTEGHPAALLGSLLVMAGAAIGRGAWMNASGCRHFPILFACVVGASSRARKTTAIANAREFLDYGQLLPPTASGLSTGEGLIYHIRDARYGLDDNGEDTTEDAGVEDKRLCVIESELARALVAMRREGNSLSAVLRECWDGSALNTLVKREPIKCGAPHVAIIAAVTGEELKKRLDETELWNGLGNRFVWLLVSRPHQLPEAGELPWTALDPLAKRLGSAIAFAKSAGVIQRSADAVRRWAEIYAELGATNHGGVAAVLTDRGEAQLLRVSMLFALLDESRVVTPPHLDAALAFWRFAEASVLAIFGGLSKAARDVAAFLAEAAPGELSRDEIKGKSGNHLYGERLDAALAELLKAGRATSRREETKGRPKELWKAA